MRVGPRAPRGTHDEPDPADEIVVFPTGRTMTRSGPASGPASKERSTDPRQSELPDAKLDARLVDAVPVDGEISDTGGGPAHDPDTHRGFHARPGHRPGATPGVTSSRSGGGSDIVRPLLVAPGAASRILLAGEVFEVPLPHLRIEDDRVDARLLLWAVAIVGERHRPVPATLHLLGSPSMVVTVLELVPARRLRWGRERFLSYGVEAMDELAHRIRGAA